MKKFSILCSSLVILMSSNVMANEAPNKRCKTYDWKPGDVITVETARYKQTHITLPESALDVIWGPKELWEADNVENHIFVKPLSPEPQGKETTATAIGTSKNSYEFEFIRVDKLATHCVNINATGGLVKRQNWDSKDAQSDIRLMLLQQQIAKLTAEKAQASEESQRQAREAVKSYRSSITSNYDWTEGSGWFADGSVESVHDDGRFTYIRLKNDEKGIMSISAEIDGRMEILEKVYDATKREYRIAGIYPKFLLRAGKSEMTVSRKG